MTLRVSFRKLTKEITKNHLASLLVVVLVFVIHLIGFFMSVQNTVNAEIVAEEATYFSGMQSARLSSADVQYIIRELKELCAPNTMNIVIAMLIATYLAFDYFRYLHSRKETDFFDSLPVRRKSQFFTRLISCFGIFAILAILTLGIELGIVYSTGFASLAMVQGMLWNLCCMLAVFLATWTLAALAMIMTGHSIIALLSFGTFTAYVPLILCNVFPVYANKFFDTYHSSSHQVWANVSYYFSPATLAYKLVKDYNHDGWHISRHWSFLIGLIIFILIIGTISYLLFLRRPSEAAGRAMAFEKANPIIRFLLVIPLSLYLGFFLSEMNYYAEIPWLIFGIIFGAALLHGIIECIFQFDIRALFSKKRQLLITIVLSIGFVCIFWFDILGYDEYIPKADDVNKVEIQTDLIGDGIYNYWGKEQDWLYGEYVDDALLVAEDMINIDASDFDESWDTITFVYHMKNGMKKYRSYRYSWDYIPDSLNSLCALEEFKDDYCSLYTIDRKDIQTIYCHNGATGIYLPKLTDRERNELIDTFLEEYEKVTCTDILSSPAVLRLVFEHEPEEEYGNSEDHYYIYPQFIKTLSLLREYGVVPFQEDKNIEFVNLQIYDDEYWKENGPTYISDREELKKLQPDMIPSEFIRYHEEEAYIYCDLQAIIDGKTQNFGVSVRKDKLPPL